MKTEGKKRVFSILDFFKLKVVLSGGCLPHKWQIFHLNSLMELQGEMLQSSRAQGETGICFAQYLSSSRSVSYSGNPREDEFSMQL